MPTARFGGWNSLFPPCGRTPRAFPAEKRTAIDLSHDAQANLPNDLYWLPRRIDTIFLLAPSGLHPPAMVHHLEGLKRNRGQPVCQRTHLVFDWWGRSAASIETSPGTSDRIEPVSKKVRQSLSARDYSNLLSQIRPQTDLSSVQEEQRLRHHSATLTLRDRRQLGKTGERTWMSTMTNRVRLLMEN